MTTVTKKKTAEVNNIGAIKHLKIEIPEDGGIVVFRGRNGQGKTTALNALQSAITGTGSLDLNDEAASGNVDAFGVTLTVGKSTRRKGELEIRSLEGRLSLGDLIEPMLKTPEAADAKRIKALVQLSGVNADAALFAPLVGSDSELRKICRSETLKHTDPVAMAEAIKRDLEAEARREEDDAKKIEGVIIGHKSLYEGLDLTQPSDPAELQAKFEAAVENVQAIASRASAHRAASMAVEAARQQIQEQEAQYTGPSVTECIDAFNKATASKTEQGMNVDELRGLLRIAEETLNILQKDVVLADNQLTAARRHEASIASAKAALATTIPESPCQEELQAAQAERDAARQAVELGSEIRKALAQKEVSAKAEESQKRHEQNAEKLRKAAKDTDSVLSGIVQRLGTSLRVKEGRLVLDTKRGETYYNDLSDGERAKIAIDIAIGVVGEQGGFTLDQHIYEGLDPVNRQEILTLLKKHKAVMLTAEVSADESITTEVL